MPFGNYSQLTDEVVDLINRGDLRPKVPGWITLAERECVQAIQNLKSVIYIFSGTLTADTATLTLPTGTAAIKALQLDENPIKIVRPVSLRELQQQKALISSAGQTFPGFYAFQSDTVIEMVPTPQANTPYTIYYEALNAPITDASVTSQLLVQAPQVLLYGAAQHSSPYLRDDKAQQWQGLLQKFTRQYAQWVARNAYSQVQVTAYGGFINDRPSGAF